MQRAGTIHSQKDIDVCVNHVTLKNDELLSHKGTILTITMSDNFL